MILGIVLILSVSTTGGIDKLTHFRLNDLTDIVQFIGCIMITGACGYYLANKMPSVNSDS